jgi:hypothetical protein
MNRRDFAKGLAALPFIGSVKSFASICNSSCLSQPHSLWVALEGPFAVVMDSSTHAITAFTPRDNGEHLFAFNGAGYDNKPAYNFTMTIENWPVPPMPPPSLCVQNDSSPFCAENTEWKDTKDYFITINLPAPNRIIVYDSVYGADMQDNTTTAPLPYAHVLEYDLNGNTPMMIGSIKPGTNVLLSPVTRSGNSMDLLFRFEIGLINTLGGDSDPNGNNAKSFYNTLLLPHFPKLASQGIRNIGQVHKFQAERGIKPKSNMRRPPFTTTTFECKSGGLLVTPS